MSIHALWCHPRSVSTAFERVMRARGDLQVLHEPFMYHHYLTQSERLFPDFSPEPGHPCKYGDIRQMILDMAVDGPVFFKDMAYYVLSELPRDTRFLADMSHAFLVRDPAESILSYYKRDPAFTRTELGIEAQFRLYQVLVNLGQTPLVITADQLRASPEVTLGRYWVHVGLPFAPNAFRWDDTVPEGWRSVVDWHADVLSKGAIQRPERCHDHSSELEQLGPPFTEYERHHRPFYAALREVAEAQAHQK